MTVNESRLAIIKEIQSKARIIKTVGSFLRDSAPRPLHDYECKCIKCGVWNGSAYRMSNKYEALHFLVNAMYTRLYDIEDYLNDLEYSIENKKPCALVPQTDGNAKEGDTA